MTLYDEINLLCAELSQAWDAAIRINCNQEGCTVTDGEGRSFEGETLLVALRDAWAATVDDLADE